MKASLTIYHYLGIVESRLHDNPVITMLNESDEDVMYGSDNDSHGAYRPLQTRNNFMNKFDADSDWWPAGVMASSV